MRLPLFLTLLFAAAMGSSHAQTTVVSGRITDAENGELLIGVTVEAVGMQQGKVSNEYGFYSFSLPCRPAATPLYCASVTWAMRPLFAA